MQQIALDAAYQQAKIIPTDGVPAVLATLAASTLTMIGINFMHGVKQFDPAGWDSSPLASHARIENPARRLLKAFDALVPDDRHTPAIDGSFENIRPLTDRKKMPIAQGMKNKSEREQ